MMKNLWKILDDSFDTEAKEVRGRVDALFYSTPRFSTGRLVTDSGGAVRFAGSLMVAVGDVVTLHGAWDWDPKYGKQFKVTHFKFDQKMTVPGLEQYLVRHPRIPGIGPVRAKRIAEMFGADFDRAIDQEPERVAELGGLSLDLVQTLREEWIGKRDLNASMTWLASLDLTHHQITLLIEKFGNSIVRALEMDPYAIVREIPKFGFNRVDQLAHRMGMPKDHLSRVRAGLLYCIAERRRQGDCWVYSETLLDDLAADVLGNEIAGNKIWEAFEWLVREGKIRQAVFDERFIVADSDLYDQEVDLAEIFSGWAKNKKGLDVEQVDPRLNEGQRAAVLAAAAYSIVLLTGGAGSGKTFTIAAITDLYRKRGLHVALAAPTGKAARRMEELVRYPASTIHRLLGFNGRVFTKKIAPDVIIVDEFSMVDVTLAWNLFDALDLSKTNVVLVGDHNQLPPVLAGNILRDLFERRPVPTVVLDRIVRQAGALKDNSNAILKGDVRSSSVEKDWIVVDDFDDALDARRFIFDLYESILVEELHFDLLKDVQLLSPMKDGPLGTHVLNAELQRIVQKKLWGVEVNPPQPGRRPEFLLHDRVIQTKNNYDIDVMNGTIGTVVRTGKDFCVHFDGRDIVITDRSELSLAYALTFHKAQGSEFPCAVVVIHRAHSFMHHRNLFYTGVTRAQKKVIVVGDSWGMHNCAKTVKVDDRKTFLSVLDLPRFEEG